MIMISFFLGKRNKKRERKKKKMIFSRGIKKKEKLRQKKKVSISIKFPFFLDFTSKMLYLCSVFSS